MLQMAQVDVSNQQCTVPPLVFHSYHYNLIDPNSSLSLCRVTGSNPRQECDRHRISGNISTTFKAIVRIFGYCLGNSLSAQFRKVAFCIFDALQ